MWHSGAADVDSSSVWWRLRIMPFPSADMFDVFIARDGLRQTSTLALQTLAAIVFAYWPFSGSAAAESRRDAEWSFLALCTARHTEAVTDLLFGATQRWL
ncbi:hypothetical protein WJX79_008851 [Trebouxia sp. C0005]